MKSCIKTALICFLLFRAGLGEDKSKIELSGAISWYGSPLKTSMANVYDKGLDVQITRGKSVFRFVVLGRPFVHTQSDRLPFDIDGEYLKKSYIHAGLEYLRILRVDEKTNFYAGGGPALQFTDDRDDYQSKPLDSISVERAWAVRFGAEYRFQSKICLRLEYLSIIQLDFWLDDYYRTGSYQKWRKVPYFMHLSSFESFPLLGIGIYF